MTGRTGAPLVAGIDSSTQATKVVVREAETGALVREARAPHPPGTEVEPSEWEVAGGDGAQAARTVERCMRADLAKRWETGPAR